jgi:predicted kinase
MKIEDQLDQWEGEYHYPSGLLKAAAVYIRLLKRYLANVKSSLADAQSERDSLRRQLERLSRRLHAKRNLDR